MLTQSYSTMTIIQNIPFNEKNTIHKHDNRKTFNIPESIFYIATKR